MASASQTPKVVGKTKGGKDKERTLRGFRPPRPEDDVEALVLGKLKEKMPEWQVPKIIPDEAYPEQTNDDRLHQYGMPLWRDMFSPRQLYGHGTSVEVFHDLVVSKYSICSKAEWVTAVGAHLKT
jgi:adenine-specific DNA methylase